MGRATLHVVDASAILCLLFSEIGADRITAIIDGAALATVNYTEILSTLIERGVDPVDAVAKLDELPLALVPLDRDLAETAARLRPATRARSRIAWVVPRNPAPLLREIERGRVGLPTLPRLGLSLGDRCCLALALRHGAVAVTADRA